MDQPPKKLSPEILAKLKAEKAKRDAAKKAAEEISAATKNEQDESSRLPGGTGTISDERGTRFYKNGELYHQTTRSDYAPAAPIPEFTTKAPQEKTSPVEYIESPERFQMTFAASTEASKKHPERNEDAFLCLPEEGIFLIADGVSGGDKNDNGGKWASTQVVEKLKQNKGGLVDAEALTKFFLSINEEMVAEKEANEKLKNAGTTAVIVKIFESEDGSGKKMLVQSVGDSRVYIKRKNGGLEQITIDDTALNAILSEKTSDADKDTYLNQANIPELTDNKEYIKSLNYNENQIRELQSKFNNGDTESLTGWEKYFYSLKVLKSSIVAGLGNEQKLKSNSYTVDIDAGDEIILTSDGIHDNLTDIQIEGILNKSGSNDEKAKNLVAEARKVSDDAENTRAKSDDMTAIVIKVSETQEEITEGFDTDGKKIKIGDTIYWSNLDNEDTYCSGEILGFKRDPSFHFLMADIKMPDGKIELMYLAGSHLIKPTKKVESLLVEPTPEPIPPETRDEVEEIEEETSPEEFDDLYLQALKKLKEFKTLDLSILQRILKINYKTASKILDKIFSAGLTDYGDLISEKEAELDRIIAEMENKGRTEPADAEEETTEQPPAPETPTTGSNKEKLVALDETIKNAKEKIRTLNLELAEAMRAEKSDTERSLETELAGLKKEFEKNKLKLDDARESILKRMLWFWRVSQYTKKHTELSKKIYDKERLLDLERDRKENPFKHFLLDGMADKNRKIIFGEKPTLNYINERMSPPDGRQMTHLWNFRKITSANDYVVYFSPTGFYVKVSNPDKITNQKYTTYEAITQNKETTYDLVKPDGEILFRNLDHKNAKGLLLENAELYQERQQTLFEDEKEIKELESIVGLDARREFLERKRAERIRNIGAVKNSIDSYTRLIEREGDNSDYITQLKFLNDEPLKYFEENLASNRKYGSQRMVDENIATIKQIEDINKKYDDLIASL